MESTRYPPPKRRRTSSADSSKSRHSTAAPRSHAPPLQHAEPTRSARDTGRERGRRYSSSDASGDVSRRRSRSGQRRRGSRSPTASSAYDSAPEHQRRRSRSYTSSPERSRSRSISRSRPPTASPPPAQRKAKSLNFVPLLTISRAHDRGITCLKFSPDMALLATASADNAIHIYSVPSELPKLHTGETASAMLEAGAFQRIRTLRAHLAGVNTLSWSPVGPPYTLASGSDDKSILLWSPLDSDFPISPSPLTGHSNYVYSLAFSPKGNMLVSGSYDEAVFLWDVRSGRVMRSLPAHSDPVGGVDFLRDGTMVASCAGDGLIRIWDAGTGQCLKTLVDEDRKAVTSVRFTPNGKFLLAWTLDNSIRLWNYIEGRCVKTYQGHANSQFSLGGTVGSYVYDLGETSDEQLGERRRLEAFMASGSEDGDVVAWDVSSKDILWRLKRHKDVVLSVDFGRTKTGKGLLVSGGKDRDLRIWMLEDKDESDADFFGNSAEHNMGNHADNEGNDGMDMDMDDVVEGPTAYGNGNAPADSNTRHDEEDSVMVDGVSGDTRS